jgi:hypothetical protein
MNIKSPKLNADRPPPTPPIASEQISIERKNFFVDLKENHRGRYLKITEEVGGRRNVLMLPIPALAEFVEVLKRLSEFEAKL